MRHIGALPAYTLECPPASSHNSLVMSRPLDQFPSRLKELRKERQLRQEDLAFDLNVSRQTISKYERGQRQPDYRMLIEIADYFQVSLDYLFGRTDIKSINILDDRVSRWIWPAKVAEDKEKENSSSSTY